MAIEKRVLITGCGRSGTKYVSVLLARLGLDVRHEKMGEDGIATWCMAVDCDDSPWGGGRRGFTFKTVVHQVRHPLKVIPSVTTFTPASWDFIARYIPCSKHEPMLSRAAKYWYYWNLEAERTAQWRYRVETIDDVFNEFCLRVGVQANRVVLQNTSRLIHSYKIRPSLKLAKSVLNRLHLGLSTSKLDFMYDPDLSYTGKPFSWSDLGEYAPEWVKPIQELSYRYGYTDVNDRVAAQFVQEKSENVQYAAVQSA